MTDRERVREILSDAVYGGAASVMPGGQGSRARTAAVDRAMERLAELGLGPPHPCAVSWSEPPLAPGVARSPEATRA